MPSGGKLKNEENGQKTRPSTGCDEPLEASREGFEAIFVVFEVSLTNLDPFFSPFWNLTGVMNNQSCVPK